MDSGSVNDRLVSPNILWICSPFKLQNIMAPRAEPSQLKRGRVCIILSKALNLVTKENIQPSTGEGDQETKKPRRSERLESQSRTTPLNTKSYLPSPLTHLESTATEEYEGSTVTPPESRSDHVRPQTPISTPPIKLLSSPPSDTQPFSQFISLPQTLSYDVEDEEAEGVWGYLIPLDRKFGDTLVFRKRAACAAPCPRSGVGSGAANPSKEGGDLVHDEEKYEENHQRALGYSSEGYLIGRHPECGA